MKKMKKMLLAMMCMIIIASAGTAENVQAAEMHLLSGQDGMMEKANFYAGVVYKDIYFMNQYGSAVDVDSVKSSNTDVATVKMASGYSFDITTKKAGTTVLTGYKNGVEKAKVTLPVTSIYSFSTKSPKVGVGKTKDVKVSLGMGATVKATSSKTSVCKVSVSSNSSYSATVKVKGVKAGTATVTIKNTSTKETAKLKVTVKKSGIMSVSSKSVSVKKGASATVKATLTKSGTIKAVSGNTKVCTAKVTKVDSKHAKIKITGKKAGSTNVTVKNTVNSEKITIKVTVKSSSSKTVRRALAISQDYPGTVNELPPAKYDAPAIARMAKKTGYSNVTLVKNVSTSKMKSAIQNAFRDADEDDISFFFYSGHGAQDGSLCAYNAAASAGIELIKPETVASWLKQVPGKVVVILNSCYSGNFIGKEMEDKAFAEFNQNVVAAFAAQNEVGKGGPLCSSKFYVLTACTKNQTAIGYILPDGSGYGLFAKCLTEGTGYDFNTGERYSSAPADYNKDNKLSLEELRKFSDPICQQYGKHSVQIYPTGSNFTVFSR